MFVEATRGAMEYQMKCCAGAQRVISHRIQTSSYRSAARRVPVAQQFSYSKSCSSRTDRIQVVSAPRRSHGEENDAGGTSQTWVTRRHLIATFAAAAWWYTCSQARAGPTDGLGVEAAPQRLPCVSGKADSGCAVGSGAVRLAQRKDVDRKFVQAVTSAFEASMRDVGIMNDDFARQRSVFKLQQSGVLPSVAAGGSSALQLALSGLSRLRDPSGQTPKRSSNNLSADLYSSYK
ncbi:hypothetical protein CYMTET_39078, partial [Cymbomonas tetramitiformis]